MTTDTALPALPPGMAPPVPVERRIIGLSGYSGVGKDTVAKMLVPRGYGQLAFADSIRALAFDLDPAVHDQVQMFGWDKAKQNDYVRRYLQKLGVTARKYLGPEVWVNAAMLRVGATGNYVITDVRFPNEARRIKTMGGKVVRIDRPGVGPVNGHVTEVAMDEYDEFDEVIVNYGTPEQLFELVMQVEEQLFA